MPPSGVGNASMPTEYRRRPSPAKPRATARDVPGQRLRFSGSPRHPGRIWLYGPYPLAGEEAKQLAQEAGRRARRWVVERPHSWMNRFRRILIRWEKKPENYLAFLHFACALIAFRAAGLFG